MTSNGVQENGLKVKHQQQLIALLTQHPHVCAAWLFGSRAIGTFKPNSDIDLVLEGEQLDLTDVAELLTQIELTTIPYKVDILIKHKIKNDKLIDHIEKHGVRWV
ncbi:MULTISPECIES: nucleotidyltransferase family protein [Vibrio harveyi group]|jgi:predicted nucleotidyltransferase|uniref:nucleotidyltransferase family protein n=1 Tax=Vibrio harveyi group TaxID=717610 RepID=UPI001BD68AB3|nr:MULTISPECIES: nucleotidyltransferase domain-containing protein [Vibrio harveyi group]MBS9902359.1 nucleotidyltransferase domain-containing protein [Vibrio alginolyticus]MCG6219840.1 nucleotidyltransferase domain-containing protein [Vibrio diabolicus]